MKRIALAALLFLSSSAFAGEILIPAVYRGAGANGTLWRTEIVVSNVTEGPASVVPVTVTLHRDNGTAQDLVLHLSPMEVLAIPDAVHAWFGIENGGGIVRVTWDGDQTRIMARARVYNVGEHGEYGQSMPGLDTWRLVSTHYLPGLSGIEGNRTNVGVSNPTTADALVWIELIDTSGLSRGSFATGIPARSYRQFNDIFSYFQAGPLNAAMVRVSSTNVPVYAYASIVRNDTGDATFVAGQ
ncbi:MAG TPA: hypothetical protein VF432_21270 [Thermoanaerobaculia bacterium]